MRLAQELAKVCKLILSVGSNKPKSLTLGMRNCMFKSLLISALLTTCTASLVSGMGAIAQTSPSPAKPPIANLRSTTQVLTQVCSFLEAQKAFSVDMDITYDNVLTTGEKVQYSAYQNLLVQKPNRLRSSYVGDERVTNLYYDGKSLTLESPNLNYYGTKAAPATLDAVLNQFEQEYGVTIPMSNLASSNTCAEMKSDVKRSIFVGVDMVNREPMYHILLSGSDRDYQIWVTRDAQPLLKKAIITYKKLPGSPQYTVYLSNWNFNPQLPADAFTFTPSKDAIQIEILPAAGRTNVTQKSGG